jgi:hypothetical protein
MGRKEFGIGSPSLLLTPKYRAIKAKKAPIPNT